MKYSCVHNDKNYAVFIAVYRTYLNPVSITIQRESYSLQVFTYMNANKTVVSYTSKLLPSDLDIVLCACLKKLNFPLPSEAYSPDKIPFIEFELQTRNKYKDTIIFSTAEHTFRAVIKEESFHFSVKIGGRDFVGCVELSIDKPGISFYKHPKLAQVYSEPECWTNLSKKGKIVDLMKGSFQLCQMLFGVNTFCLDDNSNIECGIVGTDQTPPRKLDRPLSLAHLSIAEKGVTWYELHFNSFIKNPEQDLKYRKALQRLQDTNSKRIDNFEEFALINRLRKDQSEFLEPLYKTSYTWSSFFRRIPKEDQCLALFNWLPNYIDRHILKFHPTKHEWCICLDPLGIYQKEQECTKSLLRTDFIIQMDATEIQQWGGKKRRTRSNNKRIKIISFSNQY